MKEVIDEEDPSLAEQGGALERRAGPPVAIGGPSEAGWPIPFSFQARACRKSHNSVRFVCTRRTP